MSSKTPKSSSKSDKSKTEKCNKSETNKSSSIDKSKNSSSQRSQTPSKSQTQESKIKTQKLPGRPKSKTETNSKKKEIKSSNTSKTQNLNNPPKKPSQALPQKVQNKEKNLPKSTSNDSSLTMNSKPSESATQKNNQQKIPVQSTEIHKNENPNPYENMILHILKKFPDGVTIEKLVSEAGDRIMNQKGPFMNLPPKIRMKALLIILKSQKRVETTSNNLWKIIDVKPSQELFSLSEDFDGKVMKPNLLHLINSTKK